MFIIFFADLIFYVFYKFLSYMGNQICSIDKENVQQTLNSSVKCQKIVNIQNQSIFIPELKKQVAAVLQKKKQFEQIYIQKVLRYRKKVFGDDVYYGQLSKKGIPHGFGKMFKSDGDLFLGKFIQGKAVGTGLYIFSDGSYFEGRFNDNKAECPNGYYHTNQYYYEGGFKDNTFQGEGKQQSNQHKFTGTYSNGEKHFGELQWWIQPKQDNYYRYNGFFDSQGKFTGVAELSEPTGVYKGQFLFGKKQGKGQYIYNNNLRYQGEYKEGKRHGHGKIESYKNELLFQGEWKNGLPDGLGVKYDGKGNGIQAFYVEGINTPEMFEHKH